MRNLKLSNLWDKLRSSYWFLPAIMAAGAIALAFALVAVEQSTPKNAEGLSWIYQGGADGARAVLSAIAGSMATVAATAFSITIVALQLASSHFGPRLLRNFMQDQGNQVVLGTFIATFIYCLLVLRTIRGEDYQLFVPQLSVTVGVVLAIASIGVLIYFIHHASTIIQVSNVIAGVSHDLEQVTDRLFPKELGQNFQNQEDGSKEVPRDFEAVACPVVAESAGYLQGIDNESLMKVACRANLLLCVQVHPGEFVLRQSPLVLVYPGDRISPKLEEQIRKAFPLGREMTEHQDVVFPIQQLVEISLRALSPAINDPFTAIRCIDRLGAGLAQLASREFPSPYRYDKFHKLRIIAEPVTFETLADNAFNQIRHYGCSDRMVASRLLDAIANVARFTRHSKQRYTLQQHAEAVWCDSQQQLTQKQDLEAVEQHYQKALNALQRH
ncbi:MAG: DUF2254 domain-containing protein [Cyanobacteria bacterium Co-bin13]|nr:DUF2254 domain-containing protein [Cyanobacteria bacterium Co-bin13]